MLTRSAKYCQNIALTIVKTKAPRSHCFSSLKFSAKEHLCLSGPKVTYALDEFGYDPLVDGLGPMGATEPFRLLSDAAVLQVNRELSRVKDKTTYHAPPFAPNVQRGVVHHSKFIADLWKSSEVASLLSASAGIALKAHPMDYEIAHINVQDAPADCTKEDRKPVFGWHRDSQPYVCIVMLSEPVEDAIGGETLVRTRSGEEIELTFPEAGYAYLLQGSLLEHCAMPAMNYMRKTMITSFVPESPLEKDDTSLGLALQYSPKDELIAEYCRYRLDRIAEACTALRTGPKNEPRKDIVEQIARLQHDLSVTRESLEQARSLQHQA